MATATRTRRRTSRTRAEATPAAASPSGPNEPGDTTAEHVAQAAHPVELAAAVIESEQPTHDAPDTANEPHRPTALGTSVMLSVKELLAHPDNLREDAKPNPGTVANLKTDGVKGLLYPILVTEHPEGGGYLIIDGHERVLSFQEAGQHRPDLTHIPAMIRPDLAGRATQILTMLRTALHRRALTSVEEARGVQQLTLEGMSKHQIGKQVGYKRRQVEDALVVAGVDADTASKVKTHNLDLHQAAVVADFADNPQVVATLLEAAGKGPIAFDKAAVTARDDRKEAQEREARIKELTDAGITVLSSAALYEHQGRKRLTELLHDGQQITQDSHRQCPGNAVYLERRYLGYDEVWYCTDWKKHKHTDRYGSRPVSGPMTEEQKAQRRTVISNNKAMKAANEVRRQWLTALLARKSIKGAARYVAETMVSRPHFIGRWVQRDAPMLDTLLGTKTSRHDRAIVAPSANDARCMVYALAAIAAAHENEITHETWRHNDPSTARWFTFLRSLGYQLDPVEHMVIDTVTGSSAAVATLAQPHDDADDGTASDAPAADDAGADTAATPGEEDAGEVMAAEESIGPDEEVQVDAHVPDSDLDGPLMGEETASELQDADVPPQERTEAQNPPSGDPGLTVPDDPSELIDTYATA